MCSRGFNFRGNDINQVFKLLLILNHHIRATAELKDNLIFIQNENKNSDNSIRFSIKRYYGFCARQYKNYEKTDGKYKYGDEKGFSVLYMYDASRSKVG
jgi:hypothetical protein